MASPSICEATGFEILDLGQTYLAKEDLFKWTLGGTLDLAYL